MNHARIILAPDYEAAATAKAIEYFHVEHAHQFRVVVTKLGPLKAKDRLAALSSLRHQLVSDHFHFARLVQPSAPNRRRSVGAPPLSFGWHRPKKNSAPPTPGKRAVDENGPPV